MLFLNEFFNNQVVNYTRIIYICNLTELTCTYIKRLLFYLKLFYLFIYVKMCQKALPKPGYKVIDDIFFHLNWEKNSDGTKNLILRGNELQLRIDRRLCDDDMVKLWLFLAGRDDIIKLDLSYNNVTDVGLDVLIDGIFTKDNNLKYLNLTGCNITGQGIETLLKKIDNFTLIELKLCANKLGPLGGQSCAGLLEMSEHLEYLDLGDTDQTLQSIAYIMQALNYEQGKNRSLKVLDISRLIPYADNYVENDEDLADMISILLKSNKNLVELHLQKCQLDGHDIEVILIGLKFNPTLLFLDIAYNKIGDFGIESIANYLKDGSQLIGLNVAGNGIKDTGAKALSLCMPFSRIRLLDIGHNKITDTGILDLLYSIKKYIQMRIFNIWGNKITHSSCVILRRMFAAGTLNPKFTDVCLYQADHVLHVAFNPSDWYKHYYYCQLDYGVALPFRVKKNKLSTETKKRIDLKYYPTIPGYVGAGAKPKHPITCTCCTCQKKTFH